MMQAQKHPAWTAFIALMLPLAQFLVGCNGPVQESGAGGDTSSDSPPEIPPLSTLKIDFEVFPTQASKLIDGQAQLIDDVLRSDWIFSASVVAIWNTLLAATLTVPVAAYVESFNHQPELQSDGSWEWAYGFVAAELEHTARLQARLLDGDVEWKMLISQEDAYTDVLLFSGLSNLVGTAGTWTLNTNIADLMPFIEVEWSRNASAGKLDITYTNIVPNGPENGGFIAASVGAEGLFESTYQVFGKVQDNLTEIEWNPASKDGRVRDQDKFGDDEWHCWDESLLNIDCPTRDDPDA